MTSLSFNIATLVSTVVDVTSFIMIEQPWEMPMIS